jgi:hypothetical protein
VIFGYQQPFEMIKIIYFKNESLKQLEELDVLGHQSFSKEMLAKKLLAELYTRLD